MKGFVDESGRAMLAVVIVTNKYRSGREIQVWVDTGFTGDLVLPTSMVQELGLDISGSVDGILADGSQTELNTYHCQLRWFGRERDLEVIANNGALPLLGIGLLIAKQLLIDYTNLLVRLKQAPKRT